MGTPCEQFHPVMKENVLLNRAEPPTLRNVVVWIKSGPIEFRDPIPTEPVRVMVSQCTFHPHVVTVRESQPLYILNEDTIKHRFNLKRTKDKEFSATVPKKGMQISLTLDSEPPIPLVSPSFPWMNAWVHVFEHPYFGTTGMDGQVTFRSFPPGDYEVVAWHEELGEQTQTVSVTANETTELDFLFEAPKPAAAEVPDKTKQD
jgi:hypothetical protein